MAVASLQIGKPSLLSSVSISQSNFPGKLDSGKVFLRSRCLIRRKFKVCCGVQEGDKQSNGKFNTLFFFLTFTKHFIFSRILISEYVSRDESYNLYSERSL